jgi:hypothetical protein
MDDGTFNEEPTFPDIPVEAAEPDEATELLRDLTPRPSLDDEKSISFMVMSDYHSALQDRSEWESRLADWEDLYYGRTEDKTFPWVGASNFHVPITMIGVETFKPRLVEAVLGQQPPIMVVPTTPASEDRRFKVETVINWQVQSKLKLEKTVTQSAHLFLQPGLVVAKTYWKVTRQWRKFVREFPASTPLESIMEALFGDTLPRNVEEKGDLTFEATLPSTPQSGGPLKVKLKMKILEDGIQVLVEREEVEELPQVDLIDPIDFIAPAKGGQEIKDLPWCQHRLWMSEDDLRRKVLLGRYYKDTVEDILTSGTPKGDQPATDSDGYRASQDMAEGLQGDGPSNTRSDQFLVIEDHRRYDIDDDGLEEEVIFWVCPDAPGKLLGWDYLDNVYAHGRRPFRAEVYHPVPFRFYGLSFAEVLKGIQDEINAIHNQKVDYATIQNMPFGFKRASATLPPIQQRLRPGEFIDVDNPQQDILIPKWQGTPAWGQQEEATLMQYAERLTGITDITMGRQPNRVGATRTAKGTQSLLAEAGLRFKTAMSAFQRFWVGIFEDILALDQEYLPPQQEFRITGRRPTVVKVKDRTEIRGQYDLRLTTTSDHLNREQMRNDATVMMQALLNPGLIQVGIVGKKGIKRVVQDLLKSFGKDPDFYLEDDATVLTPVEELMQFNAGHYVSPVAGENVEMHMQEHAEQYADPNVSKEAKVLLRKHMGETHQLQMAMQMMQVMGSRGGAAGAPPVGQQATNAQTGAMPQGPAGQPGGQMKANSGMPQNGA